MRTINLLPPEAAQRATARRKTAGFIALAVVYVALLALVALWWQSKAKDAQDALDAQYLENNTDQNQYGRVGGQEQQDSQIQKPDSGIIIPGR